MSNLVQVTNEIFTFQQLFTEQECDAWITLSESMGFEPAPINTNAGPQRFADIRNNDRVLL
ncbi:MAG: 2OG-Fe(II) oxygenase, partial [Pirellulaceae bacterium]|nr:2OG-Fe(II) oxygenase [Pirellulaceae bacterium]